MISPSMILTESSPSRFQNRSTCFFAIRHPNGIPTSSPGHPARAFSSVRNTEMSDASSAPGFFVQRPSGPRKSRMPESVPFNCALPWNQVQNIAKTKICKNIISYPSLHSILIYSVIFHCLPRTVLTRIQLEADSADLDQIRPTCT